MTCGTGCYLLDPGERRQHVPIIQWFATRGIRGLRTIPGFERDCSSLPAAEVPAVMCPIQTKLGNDPQNGPGRNAMKALLHGKMAIPMIAIVVSRPRKGNSCGNFLIGKGCANGGLVDRSGRKMGRIIAGLRFWRCGGIHDFRGTASRLAPLRFRLLYFAFFFFFATVVPHSQLRRVRVGFPPAWQPGGICVSFFFAFPAAQHHVLA